MDNRMMMACGHTAQGTRDGIPCCVICGVTEEAPEPNLEGRMAKCPDCGRQMPSDINLAFFEYRGEGSPLAKNLCKCGYHEVAHGLAHVKCSVGGFTPVGAQTTDRYYCGCRGWD